MTRDQALQLLGEKVKNSNLRRHALAVETAMRAFANKFGQDQEKWGLAGLLHDIDWEYTQDEPEKHTLLAEQWLEKQGLDPEIIKAIKVHNFAHGIEPETLLEKTLYSVEELTGLITACALVNPKGLAGVELKSIKKKFKQPSFAAGVNREVIKKAETYLGMSLDEVIELELAAMKANKKELGL